MEKSQANLIHLNIVFAQDDELKTLIISILTRPPQKIEKPIKPFDLMRSAIDLSKLSRGF